MKKTIGALLLIIFTLQGADYPNFSTVAKKILPLTVNISTESNVKDSIENPFDTLFFGQSDGASMSSKKSLGSGFLISADGLIVTNNHIVQSTGDIIVKFADGRSYNAEIIGGDHSTDIALLKIDLEKDSEFLQFEDRDKLDIGQWVVAFGNPFGYNGTMSAGLVSAIGISGLGLESHENFIQTDININKANSGGPLVNSDGKVVGINAGIVPNNTDVGVGYAIPISIVKRVVDNIIEFGEVKRPMLGLVYERNFDIKMARNLGLDEAKGALVAQVIDGTPAKAVGIQVGDLIRAIDGKEIKTFGEAESVLSIYNPGEQIKIDLIRNGQPRTFAATLIERDVLLTSNGIDVMGLTISILDGKTKRQYDYPSNKQGVIITDVEKGSLAEQLGLRKGLIITEINKQKIENLIDFNRAYNLISEGSNFLIYVESKDFGRYVLVEKE